VASHTNDLRDQLAAAYHNHTTLAAIAVYIEERFGSHETVPQACYHFADYAADVLATAERRGYERGLAAAREFS